MGFEESEHEGQAGQGVEKELECCAVVGEERKRKKETGRQSKCCQNSNSHKQIRDGSKCHLEFIKRNVCKMPKYQ